MPDYIMHGRGYVHCAEIITETFYTVQRLLWKLMDDICITEVITGTCGRWIM
jgi:hypothetical protein